MKSFKEFLCESMGININDKEYPWSDMILDKQKTIETRNSDSLRSYVGKKVGIIRTGKGKATLVGYMVLGEPIVYKTEEEFKKDYNKHKVPFELNGGIKYGYPITNVEKCLPREIDSKGIVARRI